MSAPSVRSSGRGGRDFDKSDGRDMRRAGTRSDCAGVFGAVEDDAGEQEQDKDEGTKWDTDAGRGPARGATGLRLLLLLRCRIARAGEGGVEGARRGDEGCLGGGVGGLVVHVGLGGKG